MEMDENLSNKRFLLVPGQISERDFWAAYFWNVEVIKGQHTRRLPSGASLSTDPSKVFNPLSKHPAIRRAVASAVGRRTSEDSADAADSPVMDSDLAALLEENGLGSVAAFFVRKGVLDIASARRLSDDALVELGFESKLNRDRFRQILGTDANVGQTSSLMKEAEVNTALMEVLEQYGFEGIAREFAARGAVSLETAIAMSDELYAEIGFNSADKIDRFKRNLRNFLEASSDHPLDITVSVGSDVTELLEAFGFEELEEDLVSFGVESLSDMLELTDEQFTSMGVNTPEKITKFKRAIRRFMLPVEDENDGDDQLEESDAEMVDETPTAEEGEVETKIDEGVKELLAAFGFDRMARDLAAMEVTSLDLMLQMSDAQFAHLGVNTPEKIATFKRAIQRFLPEEEAEGQVEFDQDVADALDAFGLNAIKPKLLEKKWVSVEAVLAAPEEELMELGFADRETVSKVKRELRKEHVDEAAEHEQNQPDIAAPWELPKLQDAELSRQQDEMLFHDAVFMSST